MNNLDMLKPSKQKRQKRRDKRLHEELIECYRYNYGSGNKAKGYDKWYVGKNFEFAANKESMKFRSGGTKELSDNLMPLVRFLESKCGKYWDKVYSELCKKMNKNSMIGQHVFEHLMDFVETKVIIEDGRILGLCSWGGVQELKPGYWPKFYVHPKSGVLLKVKGKRKLY